MRLVPGVEGHTLVLQAKPFYVGIVVLLPLFVNDKMLHLALVEFYLRLLLDSSSDRLRLGHWCRSLSW